MEQHAEVVAVYAELAADFVAVALVEEDGVEQGAVAGGQVEQDLADFVFDLAGGDDVKGAGAAGYGLGMAFDVERIAAAGGAVVFEQNVIADGVDEGAQALRIAQAAVAPED